MIYTEHDQWTQIQKSPRKYKFRKRMLSWRKTTRSLEKKKSLNTGTCAKPNIQWFLFFDFCIFFTFSDLGLFIWFSLYSEIKSWFSWCNFKMRKKPTPNEQYRFCSCNDWVFSKFLLNKWKNFKLKNPFFKRELNLTPLDLIGLNLSIKHCIEINRYKGWFVQNTTKWRRSRSHQETLRLLDPLDLCYE